MSDFRDKLNRALYLFTESPLDYTNDWESFRANREKVRQQAIDDQRAERERHEQEIMAGKIAQSGGLSKWMQQGSQKGKEWRPPPSNALIPDVETGNGILLPSVKQRGKELYMLIPWVWVQYIQPSKGSFQHDENELTGVHPFCQFDMDNWPVHDDFDFSIDHSYNRHTAPDFNKVKEVFESDKNHYHMLRGADKEIVDKIVDRAVTSWFEELRHEPLEYHDVYEDW